MFVIIKNNKSWLFGNKTFTSEFKYARRFETKLKAENHKKNWGLTNAEVQSADLYERETTGFDSTNDIY